MSFEDLRPWLVLFPFVATMIGALTFIALKRRARDVLTLGCIGVALCLVINPHDLESLGFGPITARMNTAIDKANATVDQLRDLAAVLAQPVLGSLEARGRLGGEGDRASNLAARDKVIESLKRLGLSAEQIQQAALMFNNYVYTDLYYDAFDDAKMSVPVGHSGNEIGDCFGIVVSLFPEIKQIQSLDSIKSCLGRMGPISTKVSDDLEDIAQFQSSGVIRRPDVYLGRGR